MPATLITVRQPCHEDWQAMTPSARGRHCAACQQEVVDFTQKTDAEILAHFQQASGRTCGRFAATQLDRPLHLVTSTPPSSRWRAWLAAAVALWALREAGASPATAQQQIQQLQLPGGQPVPTTALAASSSTPADNTPLVIHGRVTDASTGEGIPGATVWVADTSVAAISTSNGTFTLQLPADAASTELVITCIGYEKQRLSCQAASRAPIALNMMVQGYIETSIVRRIWYAPRALWSRMRYWLANR